MRLKWLMHTLFCCAGIIITTQTHISAQNAPNNILLNKNVANDTRSNDSTISDTTRLRVVYSKDSLDAPVDYSAKDSIIFDNATNTVHLYGAAQVKYNTLNLTAQYITVDLKNNVAEAVPLPDSSGKMRGIPRFKDTDQDFTVNKLRYNFKTRKGLAYDITTKQKDVYVHGGLSKFISVLGDSTVPRQDIAYAKSALFTTCDAPHPHFGIVSTKQKVIAGKMIVVGPSQLYIGDVPTPLWLPFGFFPLFKGAHTGLIFPRDYTYSATDGFGLNNIGWYFPINDNYNLQLTGDVYVRGTFGLRASSAYVNRYKYNGNVTLSVRSQRVDNDKEDVTTRSNSWSIQWSHTKDSRTNPNWNFSANVNIAGSTSTSPPLSNLSGSFVNNYSTVTQSNLNSSISFSKIFPGKPYSLSGSFSHAQNLYTRDFTVTFPNLNFQLQTIYPFKRKNLVGVEQWYEKINFQYQGQLNGRIRTKDSLLFTDKMWQSALTGASHTLSSSVNFNLAKYFNVSPFVNYTEYWFMRQQNLTFDPTNFIIKQDSVPLYNPDGSLRSYQIKPDTTQFGKVDTGYNSGFYRLNNFSTGVSLNTRLFGLINFKNGWLRGIRHTISPTLSFSYSPDTRRYLDSLQTDTRTPLQKILYSRYQDAIFGPPSASGASAGVSYSLTNLFEYKSFNSKDSTFKKGHLLFDNINISGSYNAIADSFNWSRVSMGTGTSLFNGLSSLSVNALFDPYGRNLKGTRTQRLALQQNGRLLNFENLQLSLSSRLSVQQIRQLFSGEKKDGSASQKKTSGSGPEFETLWDFFGAFSLNHYFAVNVTRLDNTTKDTLSFQHTLNTSGSFPLSKRWRLTLSNIGYDFTREALTYPDFTFSTDLHCWEMGLGWQPIRNTYQFYLRVKPGSLEFLKVPYNKIQ